MPIKKDFDKADELPFDADQTPKGAQTTRETARFTPKEETQEKDAPRVSSRLTGAQLINGQWHDANGAPLSPADSRRAHQAQDAKDAETRRKALLGRSE